MKLKIKDIIEILDSIESLSEQKLPIKLALKIEKIRKCLLPFFERYTESIDLIKKEKALKNADGTFVFAKTESESVFSEQMVFDSRDIEFLDSQINNLLNDEIELRDSCLIKIYEFADVEIPFQLIKGIDKIFLE
jgi:hypothetical protein